MYNETSSQEFKIYQQYIFKTPKFKNNKEKDPYLEFPRDEEKRMRKKKINPCPSLSSNLN